MFDKGVVFLYGTYYADMGFPPKLDFNDVLRLQSLIGSWTLQDCSGREDAVASVDEARLYASRSARRGWATAAVDRERVRPKST